MRRFQFKILQDSSEILANLFKILHKTWKDLFKNPQTFRNIIFKVFKEPFAHRDSVKSLLELAEMRFNLEKNY